MKNRSIVAYWAFALSVLAFSLSLFLFVPVTTNYATSVLLVIRDQPPVVTSVHMNQSGRLEDPDVFPIVLLGGTTATYYAMAHVEDLNGFGDISDVEMVFYRSGVGSGCSEDPGNCYRASLREGTCTSVSQLAQAGVVTCPFPLAYWANATVGDRAGYSEETWKMDVRVQSRDALEYTYAEYENEVDSLLQLLFEDQIDFGELSLGAVSERGVKISFENIGNVNADVQVRVSDLVCAFGSIPLTSHRIDIEDGGYAEMLARESSMALSATPEVYTHLDLPARTTATPSRDDLFWSIQVPETGVSGTCVGEGVLTAI